MCVFQSVWQLKETYLIEKLLQFMLQLQEVVGADQAALDGVVTVPGQLKQLKLDKLQGTSGLEQVITRVISH